MPPSDNRIDVRDWSLLAALSMLLIPVTAILLGWLVLGEPISIREIAGTIVIGSALLVIDGRRWHLLRRSA